MDINNIYIEDMSELAENIIYDALNLPNCNSLCVFGYYEDIAWLLKELLQYNDTIVGNIELEDISIDGYDKEYILFINKELCIHVEKARNNERVPLHFESPVVYIGEDCSYSILSKNYATNPVVYSYGYNDEDGIDSEEDDECCECCRCRCCCECHCDDTGNGVQIDITIDDDGFVHGVVNGADFWCRL